MDPWWFLGPWLAGIIATMRPIYGRLRAHSIEYHMRELSYSYPRNKRGLEAWQNSDAPLANGTGAFVLAIIWPLTLLALLAAAWLASTPYKSKVELEIEVKDRDKRIRELELEAGIRKPDFYDRYPNLY